MSNGRHSSAYIISLIALITCQPAFATIFVGHPVPTKLTEDPTVDVQKATLPLGAIALKGCAGDLHTEPVELDLDLVAGDVLALPEGTWCALTLLPDGPLEVYAEWSNESPLALVIDVDSITLDLDGPLVVGDTGEARVELLAPGWAHGIEAALGRVPVVEDEAVVEALIHGLRFESALLPG